MPVPAAAPARGAVARVGAGAAGRRGAAGIRAARFDWGDRGRGRAGAQPVHRFDQPLEVGVEQHLNLRALVRDTRRVAGVIAVPFRLGDRRRIGRVDFRALGGGKAALQVGDLGAQRLRIVRLGL
jgi:hypothetical protein